MFGVIADIYEENSWKICQTWQKKKGEVISEKVYRSVRL